MFNDYGTKVVNHLGINKKNSGKIIKDSRTRQSKKTRCEKYIMPHGSFIFSYIFGAKVKSGQMVNAVSKLFLSV